MYEKIDIEKLRNALINYFGTAIFNSSPLAIIELKEVEQASDDEVIRIAIKNNFDLNQYKSNQNYR